MIDVLLKINDLFIFTYFLFIYKVIWPVQSHRYPQILFLSESEWVNNVLKIDWIQLAFLYKSDLQICSIVEQIVKMVKLNYFKEGKTTISSYYWSLKITTFLFLLLSPAYLKRIIFFFFNLEKLWCIQAEHKYYFDI